ncbi:hypothetical protein K470DRAFT_272199 [Piedraia hortae CBS 480.64]|uniref:F-box domain-containing protein n=1 Tax=Piedraia hortae CBS 480.64 TaxID=1314780 RepID=A0A6A7BU96_9PEZI|nr:hypothetical protein K470DRAFT_272199 [Piedraia hortae CBS 480.64]
MELRTCKVPCQFPDEIKLMILKNLCHDQLTLFYVTLASMEWLPAANEVLWRSVDLGMSFRGVEKSNHKHLMKYVRSVTLPLNTAECSGMELKKSYFPRLEHVRLDFRRREEFEYRDENLDMLLVIPEHIKHVTISGRVRSLETVQLLLHRLQHLEYLDLSHCDIPVQLLLALAFLAIKDRPFLTVHAKHYRNLLEWLAQDSMTTLSSKDMSEIEKLQCGDAKVTYYS